jgi:hypothetical protein
MLKTRYNAVYAMAEEDGKGRKLLQEWYARGARLFIGWASRLQTSGRDPAKDRAEQLKWRQAVRALGPDARYVDYPLPDWQVRNLDPVTGKVVNTGVPAIPTQADLDLMLDDPQCLGFFGPDEPNLSPPTGGNVWRISPATWHAFWAPILAADPFDEKERFADFAGPKLTGGWQYGYKALDVVPYLTMPMNYAGGLGGRRIATVKLCNWHPKNAEPARYGNDLPAKAVRALGWVGDPSDARGVILECADEDLNNATGRGPTDAEIWEQSETVDAERVIKDGGETQPILIKAYFPQKPKPNASHEFDNCDDSQHAMVEQVYQKWAPTVLTPEPSEPSSDYEALLQDVEDLKHLVSQQQLLIASQRSTLTVLQEQAKANYGEIQRLGDPFTASIARVQT